MITFRREWAVWAVQEGSIPKKLRLKYANFEGGIFIFSWGKTFRKKICTC